jgi:hypothetical protein
MMILEGKMAACLLHRKSQQRTAVSSLSPAVGQILPRAGF